MQTLKSEGLGICRQYGKQGCRLFGAVKHSRRSSGFAASRSPARVATVVKLQWHSSWNTGCSSTGKWWRKQETAVCKKRRSERADGPWHSCEICYKHPLKNLSPKLQAPCKQKLSFAEVTAQWAFSGSGQSPFMAVSVCLIVPVLAVWICLLRACATNRDTHNNVFNVGGEVMHPKELNFTCFCIVQR